MDPFTVLNIPPDADDAAIERAWKAKLRIVHPDRHPTASPEVRARLLDRTQELNAAYEILCDPVRRADAARARRRVDAATPPSESRRADSPRRSGAPPRGATRRRSGARRGRRSWTAIVEEEADPFGDRWSWHRHPWPIRAARTGRCVQCDAAPARDVMFWRVHYEGRRPMKERITEPLCRTCAIGTLRRVQSRQLATSWMPPLFVLGNGGAVLRNAVALWRVRSWPEPQGARRPVEPPGRPVFLRPGGLAYPLVLLFVAWLVVGYVSDRSSNPDRDQATSPATGAPTEVVSPPRTPGGLTHVESRGSGGGPAPDFIIGDCVWGDDAVQFVDCSGPHAGIVTATVVDEDQCPDGTDVLVDDQRFPACVDLDR